MTATSGEHGFDTIAIHAGQEPDPLTGAVTVPIYPTSTYKQDGVGGLRGGYEYSRSANPTRTALESRAGRARRRRARARVRQRPGRRRHACCARSCRPGDHVILPGDAYGGTYRLVARVFANWGLTFTSVPLADLDAVRAAMRPTTKVIWCETPTNPLLGIADIAALADDRARRAVLGWSSTTPSPRPTCSSRWRSAPTSSCTRRPSTSAATPTSSAAR